MIQLSEKTNDFIKKQDDKLNIKAGYRADDLRGWVDDLLERGKIEVGYRSSCGSTDRTMKIHTEWLRVLKKLRTDGLVIKEAVQKHGNAYATNNGGFWNSTIYTIDI